MPELKFDFYDYKTLFVNSKDKSEALNTLFSQWDDKALSFWHLHYQKYDADETAKKHVCNNMLNGFIQRMDEKIRRHSLGCLGVYGSEPSHELMALMLWRGSEIPPHMIDHPSFEYWTKKKLDIKNEADKKLILEYLTKIEEDTDQVEGRTVRSFNWYK